MRTFFIAAVIVGSPIGAANAQWVYDKKDDPFQSDLHTAVAVERLGFAAGLRCTSAADATLIYVTPEHPPSDGLANLNRMSPRLLVILDDMPKVAIDAQIEATPDGQSLRVVSTNPPAVGLLFQAAELARKRFAIAVEIGVGNIVYSQSFTIDGAKKTIGRALDGCKIR